MRRFRTTSSRISRGVSALAAGHPHFSVGGDVVPIAETGSASIDRIGRRGLRVGSIHLGGCHQGASQKIKADPQELLDSIRSSGFQELPVRALHAARASELEAHHNDPFDRLLIAQAIAEPLRLLTADSFLARYTELVVLI